MRSRRVSKNVKIRKSIKIKRKNNKNKLVKSSIGKRKKRSLKSLNNRYSLFGGSDNKKEENRRRRVRRHASAQIIKITCGVCFEEFDKQDSISCGNDEHVICIVRPGDGGVKTASCLEDYLESEGYASIRASESGELGCPFGDPSGRCPNKLDIMNITHRIDRDTKLKYLDSWSVFKSKPHVKDALDKAQKRQADNARAARNAADNVARAANGENKVAIIKKQKIDKAVVEFNNTWQNDSIINLTCPGCSVSNSMEGFDACNAIVCANCNEQWCFFCMEPFGNTHDAAHAHLSSPGNWAEGAALYKAANYGREITRDCAQRHNYKQFCDALGGEPPNTGWPLFSHKAAREGWHSYRQARTLFDIINKLDEETKQYVVGELRKDNGGEFKNVLDYFKTTEKWIPYSKEFVITVDQFGGPARVNNRGGPARVNNRGGPARVNNRGGPARARDNNNDLYRVLDETELEEALRLSKLEAVKNEHIKQITFDIFMEMYPAEVLVNPDKAIYYINKLIDENLNDFVLHWNMFRDDTKFNVFLNSPPLKSEFTKILMDLELKNPYQGV